MSGKIDEDFALANQGNSAAQNRMGVRFEKGQDVQQDYVQAARWYHVAADAGNVFAQCNLALCYADGRGVQQNWQEAVRWFRAAANQGFAKAQNYLGLRYDNGEGVEQNESEAVRWYQAAAEQGFAEAQYNLALSYELGTGVQQDWQEAVRWYRAAAEQGYAEAQNYLGLRYANGEGVEPDWKEAVRWFHAAAKQGHATAEYNLGFAYKTENGVGQDWQEAVRWYRASAEQGYDLAQNRLGLRYANGEGVERDYIEAMKWYRAAAEQGLPIAQYNLGFNYAGGTGVEQDWKESVHWFRKSAEQGCAEAQNALGLRYDNGEGIEQDHEEAVRWYRLAAEQDLLVAQYNLALSYESGTGVEQDLDEAARWYQAAADQGYEYAQEALERLSTPTAETGSGDGETGKSAMEELNGLTGLQTVKKEVADLYNFVKVETRLREAGVSNTPISLHMVFTGNPGTGKTTVARLIAEIFKELGVLSQGQLVEVKRQDLVGTHIGEADTNTRSAIQEALGGVLFIDEAYTLAEGGENDFGQKVISTLLTEMENYKDDLCVIVAGYDKEMEGFMRSNPGLRSRFNRYIHFEDYSPEELLEIFLSMCANKGYTVTPEAVEAARDLFEELPGRQGRDFGNARSVRNCFEKVLSNHHSRIVRIAAEKEPTDEELVTIEASDVEALSDDADKDEGELSALDELNALTGLQSVKSEVNDLINFLKVQSMRKEQGLPARSVSLHMVFSGNPGTGKTTVARLLGRIFKDIGALPGGQLVEANRKDLVAGYVGQTDKKTEAKIEEALGGVLFIDEAYTLVEGGDNDFGHEAINTLLTEMENKKDNLCVIIAGYSDRIGEFLDSNPGLQSRFNRYIDFEDYSADELQKIFLSLCKHDGYSLDEAATEVAAKHFETLVENKDENFGNARTVRNFFEDVVQAQANRVARNGDMSPEALSSIVAADLEAAGATSM